MTNDFKIERCNNFHLILFSCLFILYNIFASRFPFLIAGIFSFLYFWIININTLKTYQPFAGYANRATTVRLILVIMAGVFYKNVPDFELFLIGFTIFCLDGLDGYLARKFKQVSEFGAYLDMETDALYVGIFTVILYEKGLAGYWILITGFMRYFYGTIIILTGRKSQDKIRTKFGPLVAGIFFVSILSPLVLSSAFYMPVLMISSSLILLSFAYSFIQNLGIISG